MRWFCYNKFSEKLHKTPKQPQKTSQNTKPLKIKHLRNFFGFFGVFGVAPKSDPLTPTPTPTDPLSDPVYFYIYIYIFNTPKTTIKITKPLKIKGLGFWGSLWGGFGVALGFVALLLKTCYKKTPSYPTPCPAPP